MFKKTLTEYKDLIEIKQVDRANDYFRIDIMLGNICNYKCWYCFDGCNSGDVKWPDLELLKTNLSHLLDYYIKTTSKRIFEFNMLGGEVSHWPKFIDFVIFLKSKYNCIINLTTNASKKLSWWERAAPYLDSVLISHHHEYSSVAHNITVADFLYEQNVIVVVSVLLDPTAWNKCLDAVTEYKTSKKSWAIIYKELISDHILYTQDQLDLIKEGQARKANTFWFLKNNLRHKDNTQVIDKDNNVYKVNGQTLLATKMNQFYGWECSLGINWLSVSSTGNIAGLCGNKLYDRQHTYNLYASDFVETFNPTITSTICEQHSCTCIFELKQSKKKVSSIKVIPIIPYERKVL